MYYFTPKNGQNMLKRYYVAALHVADLGDLEWKIYSNLLHECWIHYIKPLQKDSSFTFLH